MQLEALATDVREIASQAQGLEAMRQAEREEEQRAKRARIGAGKSPKYKSLTKNLRTAANNIQGQKADLPPNATSSSSSMDTEGSKEKNDKDAMEEDCSLVTQTLQQIVGADCSELDETVKSSMAKAVQDRFKPY